ncbi:MAG: TIGR00701 family protein [Euryarchaeota archaeon]|nr:TIGR00701 family protein [Euryarchaeota archaeon]MDC0072074.1 protoporphyrinogen oxidase HemJ [Gammaproteobacteria bacterium]
MNTFLVFKTIHIISVITWMAALFYLPRLFVYHSTKEIGSDSSETFKVMESKLLKIIGNPSLVFVWISGLVLLGYKGLEIWLVLKMFLVMGMTLFHLYLNFLRKRFENDANEKSEKFFRLINELPTILLLIIVVLVVFQPRF